MQDVIRETYDSNGIHVVAFTLLPEHAQGLEAGLVTGLRPGVQLPDATIKAVVGAHLPQSMLDEICALPHGTKPTVYVIRNAPEIDRSSFLLPYVQPDAPSTFKKGATIADQLTRGVQLHMGYKSTENNPLYMRKNNKGAPGRTNDPHKDGWMVSGFSMIINDQEAPTRFTNWRGLLDEAKIDPKLGNVMVRYGGKDGVRLADFDKIFKGWEDKSGGAVVFSDKNPPGQAQLIYTAAETRHSEDIVLGPNDTALWTNQGMMLHSAREGNKACPMGQISRAAVLNLANPIRS